MQISFLLLAGYKTNKVAVGPTPYKTSQQHNTAFLNAKNVLKQASEHQRQTGPLSYLLIHLLGLAIADLQSSCLVVGAVGTRDKFPECCRAWEPSFQVKLLGRRIV